MRTLSLLFSALVLGLFISWQSPRPVPVAPANAPVALDAMAAFCGDPAFLAAHPLPSPTRLADPKGGAITFTTPDGKTGTGYYVKPARATDRAIIVIHEWWGLNDNIKAWADKLSDLGVHVLALDLYDGNLATTREDAAKFMQAVVQTRAEAIVKGGISHLSVTAGKPVKVGTVGWCFGGGWSLRSTLLAGTQASACVIYYGMPETDPEKLKSLNAPVLGIFAENDKWITPQVAADFEATLKKLGKSYEGKVYASADHGFANPSNPNYRQADALEAEQKTLAFFRKHLLN